MGKCELPATELCREANVAWNTAGPLKPHKRDARLLGKHVEGTQLAALAELSENPEGHTPLRSTNEDSCV